MAVILTETKWSLGYVGKVVGNRRFQYLKIAVRNYYNLFSESWLWVYHWPVSVCAEMLISSYLSSFLPLCLRPPDFNYNTDGYEGDGAEDGKSQDGSETLPFIDESPTMSPQLCVPQCPDGVSPTPPEGLLPEVRAYTNTHKTHTLKVRKPL